MVPASMSEPTIAEACWDIHVSICWTTCVHRRAATSAGTLAAASSAFNRSIRMQELGQLDEERDQREGDQQECAAHDQDRGADRSGRCLRTPQPRARRRSLKGPRVATAMTANRMEKVTVDR